MFHLAVVKGASIGAAAGVVVTPLAVDPGGTSADHTTLYGALIVGGLAFMGTLVTVVGNYLAQRHVKTAGEANDALVAQLVEARTKLELEKERAKSARRHAWRTWESALAVRQHLLEQGVDPTKLPPLPEQPPEYDEDDEWGGGHA